jgi:hypothetical protein
MARLLLAAVAFSAWLVLLLAGFAFGGGVHLLLAAALALFPWRAAAEPSRSVADQGEEEVE